MEDENENLNLKPISGIIGQLIKLSRLFSKFYSNWKKGLISISRRVLINLKNSCVPKSVLSFQIEYRPIRRY